MSYKSGNNNINQKLQDLQYCSPFLDVNYDDLFLPDFVFCNDCPPFCIQSLQFITGELAHISVVTHFSFEFWVQFFIQTLFRLYRGCWSFAKCCNAYNDGRRNVSYIKIACKLNKHMVDAIKNMDITDHFFQQQFFSNPKKFWLALKLSEWNS